MAEPRRTSQPATLSVIAKAAGVSTATVSRALNHPGMLLPETVQRVRQLAEQLGYISNRAARALATGQSDLVLLVVPDIANPFFPRLVRSAQRALIDAGLYGVLVDTADDPDTEARLIEQVGRNAWGVVNMSSRLPDDLLTEVATVRPTVLVNRQAAGIPGIMLDAEAGIRSAIGHLLELGHTRFAYVSGPAVSFSNSRRLASVRDSLAENPATQLVLVSPGDSTFDGGVAATDQVLASGATAVQVFDDVMAQGLMHGLLERQVRVPEDVSIVGCDGTLAPSIRGTLATVALDYEYAGAWAAATLLALRDPTGTPPDSTSLSGEFLTGDTIAPPSSPVSGGSDVG
ncbi:MAG: LacI family DNA-binding transcriptional regulator [Propionicimonas sp.]